MMLRYEIVVLSFLCLINAQTPSRRALEPLTSKRIPFNNIPFQVSGNNAGPRGPQSGFNLCNSTTEGPSSLCQTLIMNDLGDFCMWSSPNPKSTVGDTEGLEVAWCTKPGHGARLIPPGTITGAQWLYAKNYVQVVGFLDQTKVDLDPSDAGGELDPHGADEQGNPLGGIVYTRGFGQNATSFSQQFNNSGTNSMTPTQVIEWVDFIGSGMFCLKMCNPNDPNGPKLCNHIYDEIGCDYNAIADYDNINGKFEVCDSDDMTPPGVFTTAPGQTTTWFQAGSPPIPPYNTRPISSSNCHTFASSQLFAADPGTPSATATVTLTARSSSGSVAATGVPSGSIVGSGSAVPSATGTSSGGSVASRVGSRTPDIPYVPADTQNG
ncbi:hypothetical protein BU17DRAFT_64162 [Hysterangium stoloniferum]|nr:hypothetical protein BU17DRAFT_64162 [Hysterangium stoloniferum]